MTAPLYLNLSSELIASAKAAGAIGVAILSNGSVIKQIMFDDIEPGMNLNLEEVSGDSFKYLYLPKDDENVS